MSKELNKAPAEQAEPASCQGTNCGTTTGDHSSECLAEAAASQGWELKPGDLCGRDCPMRPATVEQAGGDERAALQELIRVRDWVKNRRGQPEKLKNTGKTYIMIEKCETLDMLEWAIERARAALAQPYPAQAEQAEAERPELWAVHAQGPDELYAAFTREGAEKHAAELNALPMPEGIEVGAVVVPSPWPEAEHWKYLAEQERDHKNEIAVRLRQFERICEGLPQDAIDGGWTVQGIRGYAKRLEDQLKSALARVAELEKQEPVGWANFRDGRFGAYLHRTEDDARRFDSTALAGKPAGSKQLALYAAPVAQAQHSVPEGWMLVPVEQLLNMMSDKDHDTRIMAERQLLAVLAAAPGKEVGHE
ncbi:TPA: hypothetical protein N2C25_003930 [Pseudomonas aeruginosa]|nr:hypothetical protein [Pseudomonas aeruginosa]